MLEEIAHGGMGVVFKARQRSLDRIVAVKMIRSERLARPQDVQRFHLEATAAARLQHPNIVAIHETGEIDGQHFYSMDFVESRSLAAIVREHPLPARQAAAYVKTIAEAIHYAHEHGILHRDLKPSNILIDARDAPHVTDFGLAKLMEGESDMTLTGQVLGSPSYMAPEQAAGRSRDVDARTDVYALGAILYELVSGRPPFKADTSLETLKLVVETEPVALRLLNPRLPRDLETICLKCLEKEPGKRYATAQVLAEELSRFLEGKPVLARPVSRLAKVWRWCRRNPRLALATSAALLSLLVGLAGVTWQWRRAEAQRQRAEAGELSAQRRAYISEINAAQHALKANNPGRALELLNRQRPSFVVPASAGASRTSSGEHPDRLKAGLQTDLRGFEWRYLWQQCQTEAEALLGRLSSRITALEVSRDGRWLVAGSEAGSVKLWNLFTGEEVLLLPDRGWPSYATFSAGNRLVLFTDQTPQSHGAIAIWDLEARTRLTPLPGEGHPVGVPAFSRDARWLGFGIIHPPVEKRLAILEFTSRKKVREQTALSPNLDAQKGYDWVFTADGRSVIFAETEPDCRIGLLDLLTGSEPRYFPGHREGITAMALSPDGRMLATGAGYTDHLIRLWEVPSFRSLGELAGHEGWITALKFSPDGQTLASASADQTIRLWHLPAKEPSRIYRRLSAEVRRVCFAPERQQLFSGAADGAIHRWSAAARPAQSDRGFSRAQTGLEALTVAPDGGQFADVRQDGVFVGRTEGAVSPSPVPELGTNSNCLLFSSDGRSLFSGTWAGEVQAWSLDRRHIQGHFRGSPEPVCWLGQDARGDILVAVQRHRGHPFQANPPRPHAVSVWDVAEGHQRNTFSIPGVSVCYTVSSDGTWFAAGHAAGLLQLWRLTSLPETNTLSCPGSICGVAFSPDGRLLAAATTQGAVKVWNVPALREVGEFRARSHALFALAFSPDSRRLATAGDGDEAIKLWDAATWQGLITLEHPGESLREIAFSADGHQLTAVNSQGDVLVWRVPSFAEIEVKELKEAPR
ncbi:MAG: protein kinase [Verrucomicrobia bacterium]|nr:protein kinase [Verrucomicrobiota bacterium]